MADKRSLEMEMKKLHMGTMSYGSDSMDEVAHQLALALGISGDHGEQGNSFVSSVSYPCCIRSASEASLAGNRGSVSYSRSKRHVLSGAGHGSEPRIMSQCKSSLG